MTSAKRALAVVISLDALSGGPATVVVNASIAQQRKGIRTTVAYTDSGETREHVDRLAAVGVETRSFLLPRAAGRIGQRWGLSPRMAWWLTRHVRDYDFIHVHSAWGLPNLVAAAAAKVARRPVVMSPHESFTDYDLATSGSGATRMIKRILRRVYPSVVDLIVFSSDLERRDSHVRGRTAVVPHPVIDELREPAVEASDTRPPTVGFLGRLDPKKNVDVLLRALALMPRDTRLIVAGDGPAPLRERLHALADELQLSTRTEWRGFVRDGERSRVFRDIDVLAMPSAYECFGMVAAEAIESGVPAVVSDRTGMAEVIAEHGGGVVSRAAPEDLAAALSEVLGDRAGSQTRPPSSRRSAFTALSFGAYAEQICARYESVTTNSR